MRPDLCPTDQPFERVAGRHWHQWHVVGRLPPALELVGDCRAHRLNGPALLRCDVAVDVGRHRPRRQKREWRRHCNRQRDHGPCGHDHAARCQQLLCLHSWNRLRRSWHRNDGFTGTDPGKRQDGTAIPMGASPSNVCFAIRFGSRSCHHRLTRSHRGVRQLLGEKAIGRLTIKAN